MAMLVHLAPEGRVARIRRHGVSRLRRATAILPGGVFAVPVTPSFFVSHQWLRELKRRGAGPIAGVYFRISDGEPVWVGHYGQAHREMTAAEAVAEFMRSESREGWEVLVPRRIAASEIHRVRSLPQVVGWRYFPGAKGKPPFCTCEYCIKGQYGAARLRQRRQP
ncbi:MAG: hypothetical protein JOZ15_05910 [Acidobacteria bacterium]|nr:hypothetical protein [Acidobacteriota bacterium]